MLCKFVNTFNYSDMIVDRKIVLIAKVNFRIGTNHIQQKSPFSYLHPLHKATNANTNHRTNWPGLYGNRR